MLNLKRALAEGQVVIGTWMLSPSPHQVEMTGYAGFDFLILDTEHSSYDLEAAENLIRAADAAQMPTILRVSENVPVTVGKALDVGAQGIVVPHVERADAARAAVANARYAPLGRRGAAPTVRAARYGYTRWPDYLARAQSETLIVVQIEGREGIGHLDEIMAVEGVDVVFIGTFDLSESLGVSGQMDHPALLDAAGDIVRRARSRGIALGIWMPGPDQAKPWIARGVQMITMANNDMIYFEACRAAVQAVRAHMASPPPDPP